MTHQRNKYALIAEKLYDDATHCFTSQQLQDSLGIDVVLAFPPRPVRVNHQSGEDPEGVSVIPANEGRLDSVPEFDHTQVFCLLLRGACRFACNIESVLQLDESSIVIRYVSPRIPHSHHTLFPAPSPHQRHPTGRTTRPSHLRRYEHKPSTAPGPASLVHRCARKPAARPNNCTSRWPVRRCPGSGDPCALNIGTCAVGAATGAEGVSPPDLCHLPDLSAR